MAIKILHIDSNNPILMEQLQKLGFENHEDFTSSKEEIELKIKDYQGIVIRSRFKIDKTFLDKAVNLQFIARVGAGLESIDCEYASSKNITLIAAPEGNRNAVAEHTLGMLLSLFNKLNLADKEIRSGLWNRESNRVMEIWENPLPRNYEVLMLRFCVMIFWIMLGMLMQNRFRWKNCKKKQMY